MNFDSIRSYQEEEIPAVLERLSTNKQFINLLSTIYPLIPKDSLRKKLLSFKKTIDFQREMIYPFLQHLEANQTKGIELVGLENIDREQAYLYISNHRDIILDSAFLCAKLLENNLDTVEIAIGDNLLVFPWVEDMVRFNKSFLVRRSVHAKQMLESSRQLSAYIHQNIQKRQVSSWIAQREGRAKDSNDKTQVSLLKMLSMAGEGSVSEKLASLRICPLSISYEYDPCDYLKAKEFQQKRDNPGFTKSPEDDILHMQTGVMGYKGKVVYKLAGDISQELLMLGKEMVNRNEFVSAAAELIDRYIYANYTHYTINKVAFDLLNGGSRFEKEYSLMEKLDVEKYLEKQILKINLPDKDTDFLRIKLLEMYANPLQNTLNIQSSTR